MNSSTADDTYEYRARELNPDGTPKKDAQGNLIYKSGSYESALAAALAENGVITAADGDATINKTKDGSSISITNMCNAIYRNDSSAREFIDYIEPKLFLQLRMLTQQLNLQTILNIRFFSRQLQHCYQQLTNCLQ